MAQDVPPIYNGRKTSYSFGDGFMNLGTFGKVVDAGLLIASGGTIPIVIEVIAWNDAKNNEKAARAAMARGEFGPPRMPDMQGAYLAPEVGTRFRDAVSQSQSDPQQVQRF